MCKGVNVRKEVGGGKERADVLRHSNGWSDGVEAVAVVLPHTTQVALTCRMEGLTINIGGSGCRNSSRSDA